MRAGAVHSPRPAAAIMPGGATPIICAVPAKTHRQKTLQLAHKHGVPATAVWLDITPQLALQRNLELPPEKRLPESTVRHAFALYQQPSTDEGFAAVQIVPADADLNAA